MLNKIREQITLLEFWWAKRNLRLDVDFSITNENGEPTFTFLTGEYKGVKVQFGVMRIPDEVERNLDFVTYVVDNPHNTNLVKTKFDKHIRNLVRVMLGDLTVAAKVTNESRTHDFDEPNEEREFHEEVDTLLEARVSKRKSRKKAVRTDADVHPKVQQPTKPKRARARTTGKKRPIRK